MLGSIEVGVLLFISLVLASLLSAIIIARFLPSDPSGPSLEKKEHTVQHGASIFVDAVSSSVDAMLRICGFVLFFGLLQGLLRVFSLPDSLSSLCLALLEVSTGCRHRFGTRRRAGCAALHFISKRTRSIRLCSATRADLA